MTNRRPRNRDTEHPITMSISPEMLRQLLRLATNITITGARWTQGHLELHLDVPHAPDGTNELLVTYQYRGGQDPIRAISTWSTRTAS